jgi:Fructose-1-6-bisphosphatase, N-terminal domain
MTMVNRDRSVGQCRLFCFTIFLFLAIDTYQAFSPVKVKSSHTVHWHHSVVLRTQQQQQQQHELSSSTTTSTKLLFSSSSSPSPSNTTTGVSSFDPKYFTPPEQSYYPRSSGGRGSNNNVDGNNSFPPRITLQRFISNYVKDDPELRDLENVILAVQMACKTISNLVHRAGLVYSIKSDDTSDDYSDGRYYSMKRLDKLSTAVLKNALKFTGSVKMIVPEAKEVQEQPGQHQPGVLIAYDDHNLLCLDPLDGSGNADASICTGTVFGIFSKEGQEDHKPSTDIQLDDEASLLEAVLQPARRMRAAGYCLYSSATVLVFSLGSSVYGTYDR